MRLGLSRRATYALASVAAVGGLLEILAGQPATSNAADGVNARSATPSNLAAPGPSVERQASDSSLTPAAAKLLLALAKRTTDAQLGSDLFAPQSWFVAPPPPPPPPPAAPAVPTAPPLPYTFVGSFTDGDQATVYFLTRNDRVYDVKPGDTLDQIYSVDAVENGQLLFTYKPLNIRQSLPVGGSP